MKEEELRKKEKKQRPFSFYNHALSSLQSTHPKIVRLLNNFIKLEISPLNHVLSILFVDMTKK